MGVLCGFRAIWLSRNEAVSLGEAWGTRSRGYPIGRLISGDGINAHRGTDELDAALEDERPSVETQGEKYGSHR